MFKDILVKFSANEQFLVVGGIIVLLIAFGVLLKIPVFKGWIGEIYLHLGLKLLLPKDKYHLFRDVTLPTAGISPIQ